MTAVTSGPGYGDAATLPTMTSPAPDQRWDDVRLHVVTGKGGTGKSTVAAALALGLASRGRTSTASSRSS